MAANYPTTDPTFTPVVDGVDYPQAVHINGLADEIVAIGTALRSGGLEHNLFPQATGDARTLGTTSQFWGLSYLAGLTLKAATELTIATGVVTATQGFHSIDTESNAASDDLDTITAGSGLQEGSLLILRAENTSRVVTLKDGSGNLLLNGDYALSATDRTILLIYDGTNWREIARSSFTVPSNVTVLDRDVTVNDVNTTTTETTVYSYTVPANTLGSTKQIRLTLIGDYLDNSGGASTLTIRLKLGGTTIMTGAQANSTSANRGAQAFRAIISAANATNAQRAYAEWSHSEGSSDNATGTMALPSSTNRLYTGVNNSISVDATTALALVVTVQHSVSNAGISFRCHAVVVEGLD